MINDIKKTEASHCQFVFQKGWRCEPHAVGFLDDFLQDGEIFADERTAGRRYTSHLEVDGACHRIVRKIGGINSFMARKRMLPPNDMGKRKRAKWFYFNAGSVGQLPVVADDHFDGIIEQTLKHLLGRPNHGNHLDVWPVLEQRSRE